MSKKAALILFISIVCCLSAKAQRDTLTYYVKNNGAWALPVNSKDSADFYRVILPPDTNTDKNLFVVNDFYMNGKPKMKGRSTNKNIHVILQGISIEFYPNGQRKSVRNFVKGKPVGNITKYFPNGKLYMAGSLDTNRNLTVTECRDSSGKILAEKGNGQFIKYSDDFKKILAEGRIVDGLEEGEWHGHQSDSIKYICTYERGFVKKGISYDNRGKEYPFTAAGVAPMFKGGMDEFYKFIGNNVHYPKEAKRNNIQGKVFLSFVINRDGTLSDVKVIRGIGGGCDEESVRVLKMSPPWRPGIQFGIPVRVVYTLPLSFALRSE
jgi:TonB family protein